MPKEKHTREKSNNLKLLLTEELSQTHIDQKKSAEIKAKIMELYKEKFRKKEQGP